MRLLDAVLVLVATAVFWGTVWMVGGLTTVLWVAAASAFGLAVMFEIELRRGGS